MDLRSTQASSPPTPTSSARFQARTGSLRRSNPEFERLHKRYHVALISGCNNKVVQDICSQLYDHATRYRLLSHVRLDKNAHAARAAEHREITAAALAREVERSVELCVLSTDGRRRC